MILFNIFMMGVKIFLLNINPFQHAKSQHIEQEKQHSYRPLILNPSWFIPPEKKHETANVLAYPKMMTSWQNIMTQQFHFFA